MPKGPMLFLCMAAFVVQAEPPAPTFSLSFEHGLSPERCVRGSVATVKGTPRFVPGVRGKAMFVPSGCTIAFPVSGHVRPEEGTIALWARLTTAAGRPQYARLFEMADAVKPQTAVRITYPGGGSVVAGVVSTGGKKYTPWPLGDARIRGQLWQHYAVTWGAAGAAFYVNGVTLTASDSMPTLRHLPKLFFVGSEPTGVHSALTAIDEVRIYDRALHSHEIRAIAGLEPYHDINAPNWVTNSSFELGMPGWQVVPRADRVSTWHIDDVARYGKRALLIDRRPMRERRWSAVEIIGQWTHLQRDEKVTLSAWVKADRPGVALSLRVQRGVKGRAIASVPRKRELMKSVSAGPQWKRVYVTDRLALAYKDAYRPKVVVYGKGCRVWIDAVQFNRGGLRPFAPAKEFEASLIPPHDDPTCDYRQPIAARWRAFNYGHNRIEAFLHWRAVGPNGEVDAQGKQPVTLDPHSAWEWPMDPWTPKRRGPYTLTATLCNADGDTLHSCDMLLAVIRDHKDTPSPPTSPFGVHGGGDLLGRRIGLAQTRDVGSLSWRWLEYRKGDWQGSVRRQRYAELRRLGYHTCATIIGVPPWAARKGKPDIPADFEQWFGYARRIVREFKDDVDVWELWNEPDLNAWFKAHPEDYVRMLKTVRGIVRGTAPKARLAAVCPAGIVDRSFAFAEKVFKLGALDYMDLLSWHPYWHDRPEPEFDCRLPRIVDLMKRYGSVKPMVFTEYGTCGIDDERVFVPYYADGWRRFTERQQAEMLVRQSVIALSQGAVGLYWYQWRSERVEKGPDALGLRRADTYGTPKPALVAYNAMIWHLEASALPPRRVPTRSKRHWVYEFKTPNGWVYVMWAPDGPTSIPWPARAYVTDLWCNPMPRSDTLTLSSSPVYVRLSRRITEYLLD